MRARSIIGGLVLALLPQFAMAQELTRIDDRWSHYVNARFGTSVDVPNIFKAADPPPANGDGRTFKSADGAELRVFGSYAATTVTEDFDAYRTWLLDYMQADGVKISYKAQGKDWLAASGTKGSAIVYVKVIEGCGATHEMRIVYPVMRKEAYDPLIGRLARSLRCAQ